MKSNSAPNDIPSKFLKIASCIVSEWLYKFFNKCMTTGEFPDAWKIAHITPIPKVHSPSSSSENRPISVLPVLSKLFEKVLHHRVCSYLTEHNLIDKRQYGFRENHSIQLQGRHQRGSSGARTPHLKSVPPISRLAPRLLHTSNTVF